ncbi:MAG TPA: DUF1080 domain-containing protein [Sphingobacteriaceae bacterium]|nr:DUF1080 domain-containing protein [Sphingobacteriaceae bacterium]
MQKLTITSLRFAGFTWILWLCGICLASGQQLQSGTSLTDLSLFKNPSKSWKIAGDVTANLSKTNMLNSSKGSGILINLPAKNSPGEDLYTSFEHGDADIELDYMMAKGANSGIYLQGRYEVQLEDTWGAKTAKSSNNGGIYERWDESKPDGEKGYGGYAPRQNASRAPGLWQHIKISFQAPRFEGDRKIENARILRVELNGVVIHENVELLGATRGAMSNIEKAKGPLRLQGDHGAVAFRNLKVTQFDKPRPEEISTLRGGGGRGGNARGPAAPILVDALVNTTLRSFMDLPGGIRLVHTISVGSTEQVHYTYDMDRGSIVQVWRGNFLDATPMWQSRGDGSSRPTGSVQRFGNPLMTVAKLSSPQAAWAADTAGSGFRTKGYEIDDSDRPTFHYITYGTMVSDATKVMENGQGFTREISVQGSSPDLYARLAEGSSIQLMPGGMYLVDDKSYYLRLDNTGGAKPVIRDNNGRKELIIPIRSKLTYSILF